MDYLEEHRELVRSLQAAEKRRNPDWFDLLPHSKRTRDLSDLHLFNAIAKELIKKESNRW